MTGKGFMKMFKLKMNWFISWYVEEKGLKAGAGTARAAFCGNC
jgi:hypothetical protein